MKTLFVLASVMVIIFLAAPNKVEAQKRKAANEANRVATVAQPGFYITLDRCHACVLSRQQQDAMLSFRSRGFSAFYGSPVYDKSYSNIEFVEKLSVAYPNPVMVKLFVGPFQTESTAQSFVSEIPSILRNQIAEDKRENLRAARAGYATRLSPKETTGLYSIEVRRVISARVTGSFARLPPEDFLIQPGIGVGRVLIGNSRSEVLAVLGNPRDSYDGGDNWRSGAEALTVYYRDGAVSQIGVSSSKFHTATGLTISASSQVFLKAFPTRVKLCCNSQGASASWAWSCWDAVTKGIAIKKGDFIALIVHRVNEAVDGGGDCKPCH